ncbi:PhoH family protein [Thomasclavelia spiroformis]|uniref:PhoH family protein n=1 Tax=Thomasclavelia spiroformis TaxID=29348 RepID=UPI00241E72EB|nr:PhoH family protein [Thomasclavelia spiroformis]MBS6115222.1 PhoH family protein [Thomasclavelia spiroformis]
MTEQVKLEEYSVAQLNNICGNHDENFKMIEDALKVEISLRGDELSLTGKDSENFEEAKKVIFALLKLVSKGINISRRDVIYALKLVKEDKLNRIDELYNVKITKTASGKMIYPKTLGQKEYYYALKNNDVVFGIGPAGTGKTYLAVVFAVDALKNNLVKKIVLTRPAVEAGENLGFLPGDLKEKVDPYLRPLYDALHDMLGVEQTERLIEKGVIEIAPLAYMRGRTLEDAYVILDEAQNTTDNQMKMFLTRLGFNSKMIITGDVTQIDLPRGVESGLVRAMDILNNVKGISFIYLTAMDVVRHPVVQRIIERYEGKHE